MNQSENERNRTELNETLTSSIAEYGFRVVIEEVRNYCFDQEKEIGFLEELQAYWREVSGLLEQILSVEEVEDYEPTD